MINPRQIEAFRAVMVTGGITSAAQALNITQPAVTRLIRDLQLDLGLTLFTRAGVRLLPTNEALSLYREVERQFIALDRIADVARDLREHRAGILRVAALPAYSIGVIPRAVGRFMAERPNLDVALYGGPSSQVADWVHSGFCELGYVQTPLELPGIVLEPLPKVAAVAILPAGHRLAARAEIGPEDLKGESFVALERSTKLRYRIDALLADHGVAPRFIVETPLSMIACGLVSTGIGVSIVDPFSALEYEGRGIVVRPFAPRIHIEVTAVWSAHRSRSPVVLDFAQEFHAEITAFCACQA
jgi:DNA-binding transcriptional LysR family regulator